MKNRSIFFLALLLSLGLNAQPIEQGFNCSSILVGKNASVNGSVLFGHNEDDGGMKLVNMFYMPSQKHGEEDYVTLKNGGREPQPSRTNEYIWMEVPEENFADCFMNEHGVVIASNSCPSREQEPDLTEGGIGYHLRILLAQRATSARDGVRIGGELVEKWGYYGSGRTYLLADKNEAWMLSVVNGKHWVAQRIPDDHVAYLPNYYTIDQVDLENTRDFMACGDLISYAIEKGWYTKDEGEFSFKKAYGSPRSARSMGNVGRMWAGVQLLSGEAYALEDEFPFSFKPPKKLAVADLIPVLSNHYEGTELDNSEMYQNHSPHRNRVMNICASSQKLSFIAELQPDMPVKGGTVMWMSFRRACTQPFIPFIYGFTKVPETLYRENPESSYEAHFNRTEAYYSPDEKAWWVFSSVTDRIDEDYARLIGPWQQKRDQLQQWYFEEAEKMQKKAVKLLKSRADDAEELLNEFTDIVVNKAIELNKSISE